MTDEFCDFVSAAVATRNAKLRQDKNIQGSTARIWTLWNSGSNHKSIHHKYLVIVYELTLLPDKPITN